MTPAVRVRLRAGPFSSFGLLLGAPVVALSIWIIALLLAMLASSFGRMDAGTLSGFAGFGNYSRLLADPEFQTAIVNTIAFVFVSVVVSFALGLPLAWLVERTDLVGRSAIWLAMLLSLMIPGFLVAMGWLYFAHPRIGLINVELMSAFHLDSAPLPITNTVGMGLVQGIALAPVVYILIAPSLRSLNGTLEDAAYTSGASYWVAMLRINVPLLLPALIAAAIYTIIMAIGAFDIPAIIGLSNRVYVFSTYIYSMAFPPAGFPDYGSIGAGGGLMVVFALILSVMYLAVLARASRYQIVTGKSYAPRAVKLGRWAILGWAFAGCYIIAAVVLPVTLTALLALLPYAQPLGADTLHSLSWTNFTHVPWDLIRLGALHTAILVACVPVAVVAASLAFSYVAVRTSNRLRGVVDAIAFLPHAIPGILFAVAASLVALFFLRNVVPIYGTVLLIGLIYVVAWLSLGTRMMNASLIQIHDELVEAASTCGAAPFMAFRRIIVPLVRPAMGRLWLFLVLLCMRELTLAAFVASPRNATLPLVGFALWTGGELNRAAAVTILIFLALLPPLAIYFRLSRPEESLYT